MEKWVVSAKRADFKQIGIDSGSTGDGSSDTKQGYCRR